MKTVKMVLDGTIGGTYSAKDARWAFCTPIKAGSIKHIGPCFEQCREDLNTRVRELIDEYGVKGSGISFNKIRLIGLIMSDEKKVHNTLKSYMTQGVRLVHHYEKKLGWPLTKVYKVDIDHINTQHLYYAGSSTGDRPTVSAYMLIGPKEWMKSSHMFSLYILLLKAGSFHRIKGFKSHKDLLKRFALSRAAHRGETAKQNSKYLRKNYKYFEILMKNIKEVYKGRSIASLYKLEYDDPEFAKRCKVYIKLLKAKAELDGETPMTDDEYMEKVKFEYANESADAEWDGIDALCQGTAADKALYNRFKKVCIKKGIMKK